MTDKRYWIWLQISLGTSVRFKEIIEEFGSAENLYNATIFDLKMSPNLSPKKIERLHLHKLEEADKIIKQCEDNNWDIITYSDKRYPEKLKNIYNPPAVLYVFGTMIDFDKYLSIAVVGTRKASSYALKCAELVSKSIAMCGGIVVSGAALGVDSSAHKGALEAGGYTAAVLGNGFGADYLRANERLRQKITEAGGVLITEYPPYAKATRYTFPERNRIISGLCDATLVVEASSRSGSMITAKHALEQKRDVFAIPASLLDYNFSGTNELIAQGATVAVSPAVLLERYENRYDTLSPENSISFLSAAKNIADEKRNNQFSFDTITKERKTRNAISDKVLELKDDEAAVYNALGSGYTPIDEIALKTSLETKTVLTVLTMLEMKGVVESTAGKRYKQK